MSEDIQDGATSADTLEDASAKSQPSAPKLEHQDWFLANLVTETRLTGLSPGITLLVGGLIVTGHIISGKEYFEELGKQRDAGIEKQLGKPSPLNFTGLYAQFTETIYPAIDDEDEESAHVPSPSYIHLGGARIVFPGNVSIPTPGDSSPGILWRGRLSSVDGFIMGELSH